MDFCGFAEASVEISMLFPRCFHEGAAFGAGALLPKGAFNNIHEDCFCR